MSFSKSARLLGRSWLSPPSAVPVPIFQCCELCRYRYLIPVRIRIRTRISVSIPIQIRILPARTIPIICKNWQFKVYRTAAWLFPKEIMHDKVKHNELGYLNKYLPTHNIADFFLCQTGQIRSRIRILIRQKVRHPTNGSGVGQWCNAQGELSLVLVNFFRDSKQKNFKKDRWQVLYYRNRKEKVS